MKALSEVIGCPSDGYRHQMASKDLWEDGDYLLSAYGFVEDLAVLQGKHICPTLSETSA